jgi:hypothetical protein
MIFYFFLFILFCLFLWHLFRTSHIQFLTKEEALRFHQTYTPTMVQQMSPQDIYARLQEKRLSQTKKRFKEHSSVTKQAYLQHILTHSIQEFTPTEKQIITQLIHQVDQWLSQHHTFLLQTYQIDIHALQKIPWRLMRMDLVYEGGYPHTREEDVISLSDRFFAPTKTRQQQMQTLLHERIHIYQKRYPAHIQSYYRANHILTLPQSPSLGRRYNPDIDDQSYYHSQKKIHYTSQYRSLNPSSVQDVNYPEHNQLYEHPLEEMAYTIEGLFTHE